MKEITQTIYNFKELSEDVQDKVLQQFRESNEYLFLEDYLHETTEALLKEEDISFEQFTIEYSLSCRSEMIGFFCVRFTHSRSKLRGT